MRTRFYLDENLPIAIATQLQRRGIETVTIRDLGFLGDSDHNLIYYYRARELSIGAACELAGVDRYTFLDFCERQSVVRQTQTPTELEAEFHRLIEE